MVQVRPVQSPTFIPNLLWAAFRYPTDTDIDIAILLAVNTSQVRMSLLVTKLTLFSAKSVFRILLCAWISILIQELKIAKKKSKSANSSMQQATDSQQATKPGQSASNFRCHLQCIMGTRTDFADLQAKASDQLFRSKLTSRACEPRAGLIHLIANWDQRLSGSYSICCSYIRPLVCKGT